VAVEDVVAGTTLVVVILVPVLALSARLALRPIVDSILKLQQAFSPTLGVESRRIAQLESRVEELSDQVRRLEEAEGFNRELRTTSADAGQLPRAGGSASGRSA
jgi:hypothetical protein